MKMPSTVTLLTQTILVATAPNLMHDPHPDEAHEEDDDHHGHRAFGVYNAADQTITLDDGLGGERARETFIHENLHAIFNAAAVDSILDGESLGLAEHIVGNVSPVLFAWLRENPEAIAWITQRS